LSLLHQKNVDNIKQTVSFNKKTHDYLVPAKSIVRVDTAPPQFPEGTCDTPLILEAEMISGVEWTTTPESPMNEGLTGQFDKIIDFLDKKAVEVDNGNPQETDEDEISATNNATGLFSYERTPSPTSTTVEFLVIDKIGNNSTCISNVIVRDTTPPLLEFKAPLAPEINIPRVTTPTAETARFFYDVPKILDLPEKFMEAQKEINRKSNCEPVSGSEFLIGTTDVICTGVDLADNFSSGNFTVTVAPGPVGITIKNVTASSSSGNPVISNGDTVTIQFSMPSNKPPVSTVSEINSIIDLQAPFTFGSSASGKYTDPSTLIISLDSTANLVPDVTTFDLKPNLMLKSASAQINNSAINNVPNPVTLEGTFEIKSPPFITSFVANDPNPFEVGNDEDIFYSVGDTFTIRFSESTNAPLFGLELSQDEVDSLFEPSFPFKFGKTYVGKWLNQATFEITVMEANQDFPLDPILGFTIVKVVGDIQNAAETSPASTSVSPPLSGHYMLFRTLSVVNPSGAFVASLPNGLTVEISFPNGSFRSDISASFFDKKNLNVIGSFFDVMAPNSDDCKMGCKLTIYFNKVDLEASFATLAGLKVFHDKDGDGLIGQGEILFPTVTEIKPGIFAASVILKEFSSISLGHIKSGGSGGDETPPDFKSFEVITCDPAIGCGTHVAKEIKFENDMPTARLPVGHASKLILRLHENSGPSALQHVSMYLNVHGYGSFIQDSDTFVRFNMGEPITVKDPHGYFSDAKISVAPRGNDVDVTFLLTFDKPMDVTDVIIRAWDYERNSKDAIFRDAIIAEEMLLPDDKILEPDTQIIPSLLIPEEIISGWAGYSTDVVTDEELLDQLGMDGNSIPSWYKEIVSKWVFDGSISQNEFVDALRFFEQNGKLGG